MDFYEIKQNYRTKIIHVVCLTGIFIRYQSALTYTEQLSMSYVEENPRCTIFEFLNLKEFDEAFPGIPINK